MRDRKFRLLLGAAVAAVLTTAGCDRNEITPKGLDGEYATLMSLGNSLTAGFTNGALHAGAQYASFPNLMSRQINGRDMTMPLAAYPGISTTPGFGSLYVTPQGGLTREPIPGGDPVALLRASRLLVPYENLGIPGALLADVLQATGASTSIIGNSFFDLILRNALLAGNRTMLQQAADTLDDYYSDPWFLTLWVGGNDVLLAATSGNPRLGIDVTPPEVFDVLMSSIAANVDAMGTPAVAIGNVPQVTSTAFFTTIPAEPIPGVKWLTEEEDVVLVLLTAQSLVFAAPEGNCAPGVPPGINCDYLPEPVGNGSKSLSSDLTISLEEFTMLTSTTTAYNATIARLAEEYTWALVDVAQALADLPRDPRDPATLGQTNGAFGLLPGPQGSFQNVNAVFSLDGFHPSEKGSAVIADLFLQAFNDTYGTDFQPVDETLVQNRLGWEQFNPPVPLGPVTRLGVPDLTTEGTRALRDVWAGFNRGDVPAAN